MALAVDRVAGSGEWIRHAPHRSELLGRASEPTDGRWQRGQVIPGLYLADDPATAIAEWYRSLAERGLPPGAAIPHDHHRWRLDLNVADLSTAERLAAVGLQPPRPQRRSWPPYQQIGEALWHDGWHGLLAPSAARPTAHIVCISATTGHPPAAHRCAPSRSPRRPHPRPA